MAEALAFAAADIARLMPLYVRLDGAGAITEVGPTLAKLRPAEALLGRQLLEVFRVKHRRHGTSDGGLDDMVGPLLRIEFQSPPRTGFKGTMVRLEGGGGYLLNLSFGIGVIRAVGDYGLSVADFPDTELTIEMLYLAEAQAAVLQESRQLIKRLQGARIAAEEKAYTDTLTGLKNRRALDFVLGRLIGMGADFGLMHVDLDFFKEVNDSMGHAAGDYVLQHFARILVSETRSEDTVARVGGDEFVLVIKGQVDLVKLRAVGERIITMLERPISFNGVELKVSASVGAAVSSDYARPDAAEMLHHADLALYASKAAGRAAFTPFTADLVDRRQA